VNANDALLVDAVNRDGVRAEVNYFGVDDSIQATNLGLFAPQRIPTDRRTASVVGRTKRGYRLTRAGATESLVVPTDGVHFAVNGAAAVETACQVLDSGTPFATHVKRLAHATAAFGRGESIQSGSARFDLVLFKNRPSLQLNLDSYDTDADTVVLAFDEYSQDPSWLFAVDYSSLARVDAVSGEKADFLELALAYAGVKVGESNTDITAVVARIDAEFRDRSAPSVHRLFLDYDQMMATRKYFGKTLGDTA